MSQRSPRGKLAALSTRVSGREVEVLRLLVDYRFVSTGQLARFFAHHHATATSALRQLSRTMRRLEQLGLTHLLPRRIGGTRAGSAGSIWTPTSLTVRLLALLDNTPMSRRHRIRDVSTAFLNHSLAIAELRIQLEILSQQGRISVQQVQTEPDCWRTYLGGPHGVTTYLKPDLFAITVTPDGYEDFWFFEVDLATEAPSRIITKCLQYQEHRRSGSEQARQGVYPAVIWLTPNTDRTNRLRERIAAEADHMVFTVITGAELEALIVSGVDAFQQRHKTGTSSSTARGEDSALPP